MLKKDSGQKNVRTLTIFLAVLLAISATALAGTMIYKHYLQSPQSPAVSFDNVISSNNDNLDFDDSSTTVSDEMSEEKEISYSDKTTSAKTTTTTTGNQTNKKTTTLKIYRNHADDSTAFKVNNMFPGDVETKSYFLEVSYKGNVTIYFHADIAKEYEKLAEVLKCTVTVRDGQVLYDGLMKDMPQSLSYTLSNGDKVTENDIYDISVYLETSVGNEYMNKELCADFRWWVNDDGALVTPSTGDSVHFCIWILIAMGSLLLNIILLKKLRTKEAEQVDNHE